jgi:predicted ATPase
VEEGIGQLQQGMAAWQATGAVIAMPAWLAHLAEAYGQAGQIEQGLATLTTALAITHQHQELWWEAEVQRLRGELLLAQEGKRQKAKGKRGKKLSVVSSNTQHPRSRGVLSEGY